jgi:hypothetical protein
MKAGEIDSRGRSYGRQAGNQFLEADLVSFLLITPHFIKDEPITIQPAIRSKKLSRCIDV